MITNLTSKLDVPESLWVDVFFAPEDGRTVLVRDYEKNLDIARWYGGKLVAKYGMCNKITHFVDMSEEAVLDILKEYE